MFLFCIFLKNKNYMNDLQSSFNAYDIIIIFLKRFRSNFLLFLPIMNEMLLAKSYLETYI